MRSPYRPLIDAAARRHGLDPLLVEAVILQESAGRAESFRHEPAFWARYCKDDPRFVGEEPRRIASSYGLMQVMYPTALDHGYIGTPEGLFEIAVNLEFGCRVLEKLSLRFQNLELVLAAYNGGPGNVEAAQPRHYARQVLDRLERLTRLVNC